MDNPQQQSILEDTESILKTQQENRQRLGLASYPGPERDAISLHGVPLLRRRQDDPFPVIPESILIHYVHGLTDDTILHTVRIRRTRHP